MFKFLKLDKKLNRVKYRDYKEVFTTIPVPKNAKDTFDDDYFAFLRVGGFNPCVISKVTNSLPAKFPLTDIIFKKAPGFEEDNLSDAISEGRVYWVDYEELKSFKRSTFNPKKPLVFPMAVFAVPKGGKHYLIAFNFTYECCTDSSYLKGMGYILVPYLQSFN